jgi:hypothetical protein
MKYDTLVNNILGEALLDNVKKAASQVASAAPGAIATGIKNNQGGTVFDTLKKPGLNNKVENCYTLTSKTNAEVWRNIRTKLKPNQALYVNFADSTKNTTNNNPQNITLQPKDGDIVTLQSGDNVYDAQTKEWIVQSTGKPNPAPGQVLNAWKLKQQQQTQSTDNNFPKIKVNLIVRSVNDSNKTFIAEIIKQDQSRFGVKTTTHPKTGQVFTKIDFLKNANSKYFNVTMGTNTMEPSFCFA